MAHHSLTRAAGALLLTLAYGLCGAQTTTSSSPYGYTPSSTARTSTTTPPLTTGLTATPSAVAPTTSTSMQMSPPMTVPAAGSGTSTPSVAQPVSPSGPTPAGALPPMPPTPVVGGRPIMFGSQMFSGRFGAVTFSGFNADYQVAVGDRVLTRLWGAVVYEAVQPVDPQGNIFIPNVGPVRVAGVRNGDLNQQVDSQVKRVFKGNVGVYATLEAAQPVKVYVTGFVRAPGLYGGLSSDSVLYYLDKAGGIDSERGSYLSVDVLRRGAKRATIDLYQFLLSGKIDPLQLQDGDAIVVYPRKHAVLVMGDVLNPYMFELSKSQIKASELLAMAAPMPSATHISIVRSIGPELRSEYHPIANAANVLIEAGDEVTITADKFPATLLVRIEGAHRGERSFVMPYGSRLKDVIQRLVPAPQANMNALQLFRKSVAVKQKENMDTTLRGLETAALTARSSTSEEAALRKVEAELILQFIERAKLVVPKGQVVLADRTSAGETLMEDGDVVRLPETSNVVGVSGEVIFPNSLVYSPKAEAMDYIALVGGYTQRADRNKLLVIHADGSVGTGEGQIVPGDEIMVFPKVETKWIEVARGITSILYQMGVAAGVLVGL